MFAFIRDFLIIAILIIGITALMGVIARGIAQTFFAGKNKGFFIDKSKSFQTGWNEVGGKKKQ